MIDSNTLNHLAHLARITVADSEKEQLARDITNIIGFIDTIQKVELLEKTDAILNQKNVARADVVAPISSNYNLVEAAPLHKDGFVQVPKVIE